VETGLADLRSPFFSRPGVLNVFVVLIKVCCIDVVHSLQGSIVCQFARPIPCHGPQRLRKLHDTISLDYILARMLYIRIYDYCPHIAGIPRQRG
jgi:hypothetical protein